MDLNAGTVPSDPFTDWPTSVSVYVAVKLRCRCSFSCHSCNVLLLEVRSIWPHVSYRNAVVSKLAFVEHGGAHCRWASVCLRVKMRIWGNPSTSVLSVRAETLSWRTNLQWSYLESQRVMNSLFPVWHFCWLWYEAWGMRAHLLSPGGHHNSYSCLWVLSLGSLSWLSSSYSGYWSHLARIPLRSRCESCMPCSLLLHGFPMRSWAVN